MQNPSWKTLSTVLTLLVIALPNSSIAGGFGWYYNSFSWEALQSYFGGGTPQEKRGFHSHLDRLIAEEKREPFFNVRFSDREVKLWRRFIDSGLRYGDLDATETKFADKVVDIIMHPDVALIYLQVKPETAPDYVHPNVFRRMQAVASTRGKYFSGLFEYGRSFGDKQPRSQCVGDGVAWYCYDTYVILAPNEVAEFSDAIKALLGTSSVFHKDDVEYIGGLQSALERAARQGRGIFLKPTD